MKTQQFYWGAYKDFVLSTLADQIESHDLPYTLTDVSYSNDTCPSVEISGKSIKPAILFLPNSWKNDGELTTEFMMIRDEEYGAIDRLEFFKDLEEVIWHLCLCNEHNTNLI